MKSIIVCISIIFATYMQNSFATERKEKKAEIPTEIGCSPIVPQRGRSNISYLVAAMKNDPVLWARAQAYMQHARDVIVPDFTNIVVVAEARKTGQLVALYYTQHPTTAGSGHYKFRVGDEWCSVINMHENVPVRKGRPFDVSCDVSYTFETSGAYEPRSLLPNAQIDIPNYQEGTMQIWWESDTLIPYSIIKIK